MPRHRALRSTPATDAFAGLLLGVLLSVSTGLHRDWQTSHGALALLILLLGCVLTAVAAGRVGNWLLDRFGREDGRRREGR